MALLELYLQTTGDDRNAGTDNGSNPTPIPSVTCTVTGGTVTFTGATGAFTGVSVGAWVSLCNSADSTSRFTGQIATNDTTIITVLYATGTGYSTTGFGLATGLTSGGAAGAVICRVGGAWAGLNVTNSGGAFNAPASGGAFASYAGVRINVKSGTYTYSTFIVFPSGTSAKPLWWRGYYSTIGDLDNLANVSGSLISSAGVTLSGATRPVITTTYSYMQGGANSILENLEFNSPASTNATINFTVGGHVRLHRCRFIGGSYGISFNSPSFHATGCYFYGSSQTGFYSVTSGVIRGCVFKSGNMGLSLSGGGPYNISASLFESNSAHGINYSAASASMGVISGNTFYGGGVGNGITLGSSFTGAIQVDNNIFDNLVNGIANNLANPWLLNAINNDFFSCSSAQITNLWESVQRGLTTETASPFVSPGGNHDYTLVPNALARQAGFPGQFEV